MITHRTHLRSSAPSQTWHEVVLSGSRPEVALRAYVQGRPGGKPCCKEMASPFGRNPLALELADDTDSKIAEAPIA